MKKILFLFLFSFVALYGYSDNRNILTLEIQAGTIKVLPDKSNTPNLHLYINNKEFAIYENDGGIPSLKLVYYDEQRKLLILLIGTALKHNVLGINATAYNLDFFNIDNKLPVKINLLSQEGYEGKLEDGNENFKYKNTPEIIDSLNSLSSYLVQLSKTSPQKYNTKNIDQILNIFPIKDNSLEDYNNIAYYIDKAKKHKESAYLLEKIIEKFPNRIVAYLNLGDAYYGLGDKTKVIKAYQAYIDQMKKKGWEEKIPKRVIEYIGKN